MKSMKNKKKNLLNDHSSDNTNNINTPKLREEPFMGPNGPIENIATLNGFKLSEGMRAACHMCNPVQEFKTLEELEEHCNKLHSYLNKRS